MKTLLFKPFERYQESHLLSVGIMALILGSFVGSVLNARFDGVLDLHFGLAVSFYTVLMDNVINVISLFIPLFIVGKIINTQTRFIDLMNVILISRIPYFLLPLLNISGVITKATQDLMPLVDNPFGTDQISMDTYFIVTGFAVVSIGAMVWAIALLYQGFKVSVNLKNKIHIIWLGLAILVAEIISKLLIVKFN